MKCDSEKCGKEINKNGMWTEVVTSFHNSVNKGVRMIFCDKVCMFNGYESFIVERNEELAKLDEECSLLELEEYSDHRSKRLVEIEKFNKFVGV